MLEDAAGVIFVITVFQGIFYYRNTTEQ